MDFEGLIFASDSFWRDHTIHCLWVYFLGEYLCRSQEFSFMVKSMLPEVEQHLEMIQRFVEADLLYGKNVVSGALEAYKKLINLQGSIRCITALTHDLGYPLKKIQKINKSIGKILPT